MKRILFILSFLAVLNVSAREVRFTKPSLVWTKETNTLVIEFKLDVKEVEVNSTQSYLFTPMFKNGNNSRYFAPVVVTGKKNFDFTRKERKKARKRGYESPYTVISGRYSKNRNNLVTYTITMPFEPWYEN